MSATDYNLFRRLKKRKENVGVETASFPAKFELLTFLQLPGRRWGREIRSERDYFSFIFLCFFLK